MDRAGAVAHVYILRCKDGTLYTGCTTDLEKRLKSHNYLKSGAKYTRARRPVELVYSEVCTDLTAAKKREAALKKLSREAKLKLINP